MHAHNYNLHMHARAHAPRRQVHLNMGLIAEMDGDAVSALRSWLRYLDR